MNRKTQKKKRPRALERRRSHALVSATASSEDVPVDVVGLVTRCILGFSGQEADVTDVVVLSAIRGILKGSQPTEGLVLRLQGQLSEIQQQPGVTTKSFRDALSQIGELASEYRGSQDRLALIRYLSLLSE